MWLAWLLLAQTTVADITAAIQKGDLERARQALVRGLRAQPKDAELNNLLGVVDAQRGQYELAEASFRRALATAPGSVPVLENLGRLYQQNRERDPKAIEKATGVYRRLIQVEKGNAEGRYQLAYLLMEAQRYSESLQMLAAMTPAAQESAQALAVRLADEVGLGSANAAQTARQLSAHPRFRSADVLGILTALEARQSLAVAQPLLLKAIEKEGVSTPLLLALARVSYAAKRHQEALGYLAHARDLTPNDPAIHFFFGMNAVSLDLVLEAKKALGEAVRLAPDNASYNYALGAVLAQEREASNAIPYFEKYCALRPDDPRGRFAVAVARFLSKDFERAAQELRSLTTRQETAAGAYYFLGRAAKEQNQLAEAERDLRSAIRLLPRFAGAHAELGHVYLQRQRLDDAERELQLALATQPDHFLANLTLLSLYQRKGDARAPDQKAVVARLQGQREAKERDLWRTIEVRPY